MAGCTSSQDDGNRGSLGRGCTHQQPQRPTRGEESAGRGWWGSAFALISSLQGLNREFLGTGPCCGLLLWRDCSLRPCFHQGVTAVAKMASVWRCCTANLLLVKKPHPQERCNDNAASFPLLLPVAEVYNVQSRMNSTPDALRTSGSLLTTRLPCPAHRKLQPGQTSFSFPCPKWIPTP